ncbi:hypothetical protein Aperf_G00000121123 [Anoplocephala perfoliata]
MEQSDLPDKYQELLATVQFEDEDPVSTVVKIHKSKGCKVGTELKLRGRYCKSIISFQNKLVFIGGFHPRYGWSNGVDLMDTGNGQVSLLPEMSYARNQPPCAASESHIFVFGENIYDGSFTGEFYENGSERWLPLPRMNVIRCNCAAVYIPNIGVLVLGGVGGAYIEHKETELLTCESEEGEDKWTWRLTTPMLSKRGKPLAVVFQQRVYVVSQSKELGDMEMLNLSAGLHGSQWTSLVSFGPLESSLKVDRMVKADNELYIYLSGSTPEVTRKSKLEIFDGEPPSGDLYVVKLETDPQIQYAKLREMRRSPFVKMRTNWGLITVRVPSSELSSGDSSPSSSNDTGIAVLFN